MSHLVVTNVYLDLGDTEVWRTSTAEPTTNGIIWSYHKDLSNYLTMWKQPQTLIFDLGNLIDSTYTGAFNTTLTATFFTSDIRAQPADLIIPVSKRLSTTNQASAFRVPDQGQAINSFSIPRNAKRAVFSISACGQASEEFWWSNVPSSNVNTFGNASMLGFSPWREVQLLIDGSMAGVVWPFPVIFTGGVVPGFWRPLVGIDAYDLKEDEIDVSAWLGVLSDGKEHTYEIRVVGIDDDGSGRATISTVGSNWVVTGKLFLWLDASDSITTGDAPSVTAPAPQFVIEQATTKTRNGTNSTLTFQVVASRQFNVESTIKTSEGSKLAAWKQSLSFSNIGNATAKGNNQTNTQVTTGVDISSDGYSRKIRYPLYCFSSGIMDPVSKSLSLGGDIKRGQTIQIFGNSVFPSGLESFGATLNYDNGSPNDFDGYKIDTWQAGNASYLNIPSQNRTTGQGQTEQVYTFSGETTHADRTYPYAPSSDDTKDLYRQHVFANNGKIAFDTGNSSSDPDKARVLNVIDGSSTEQVPLGPMDIENAMGSTRYARLALDSIVRDVPQTQFSVWNRVVRPRRSIRRRSTFER